MKLVGVGKVLDTNQGSAGYDTTSHQNVVDLTNVFFLLFSGKVARTWSTLDLDAAPKAGIHRYGKVLYGPGVVPVYLTSTREGIDGFVEDANTWVAILVSNSVERTPVIVNCGVEGECQRNMKMK